MEYCFVMVFSCSFVHANFSRIKSTEQKAKKVEHKILAETGNFKLIPSKTKTDFDVSVHPKDEDFQEVLKRVLTELNPVSFTIVIVLYEFEKTFHEVAASKIEETWECFLAKMPKDVKESFDKTLEWWNNEVCEYLPSSGLLRILTTTYINVLTKM